MMMNILYLLGTALPEKESSYATMLIQRLLEVGHRVDAVMPPNSDMRQDLEQLGVRVHELRPIEPGTEHNRLVQLSWTIRTGNYDVVHLHEFQPSWVGHLGAWMAEVPVLIHREEAPTLEVREDSFTDLIPFRPCLETLGWSGMLDRGEGVEIMLLAFWRLHADKPSMRLIIEGDGPMRSLWEQRVSEMGLTQAVDFIGVETELSRFHQQIDIFVATCSDARERLPDVMAAGKPIIALDRVGVSDLIHHNHNGCFIENNPVDNLCASIHRMIGDVDFAFSCALHARHDADVFHPDEQLNHFADHYDSLVESRRDELCHPRPFNLSSPNRSL